MRENPQFSYIPTMPDDILLFQEHNKFMYYLFLTILQTPMGLHFVRTHEGARDAQAIWQPIWIHQQVIL